MTLMSPANLKPAQVDYKKEGMVKKCRQSVLTLAASWAGEAQVELYI